MRSIIVNFSFKGKEYEFVDLTRRVLSTFQLNLWKSNALRSEKCRWLARQIAVIWAKLYTMEATGKIVAADSYPSPTCSRRDAKSYGLRNISY